MENKLLFTLEAVASDRGRLLQFKRIYDDNREYVRKTVYWLVKSDAVDDIVQEVFVKVWKNLDRFREQATIRTWIYRISVNSAFEHLRRSPGNTFDSPGPEQSAGSTPEEALSMHELIRRGILELPEKQRGVFVLFYKQELSVDEVAKALGLRRGTVKSRLFHARASFMDFLSRNGVDYEKH